MKKILLFIFAFIAMTLFFWGCGCFIDATWHSINPMDWKRDTRVAFTSYVILYFIIAPITIEQYFYDI